MSTLEKAITIAANAHAGQIDKAGAHYILHPLRVMLKLDTVKERIVAVLHDVIEDTAVSFEDLANEGFSPEILEALHSVTRMPDEEYEEFVRRAGENPIGRRVKLADLEDNCDLSRIDTPTERDFARIEKYRKAIDYLLKSA